MVNFVDIQHVGGMAHLLANASDLLKQREEQQKKQIAHFIEEIDKLHVEISALRGQVKDVDHHLSLVKGDRDRWQADCEQIDRAHKALMQKHIKLANKVAGSKKKAGA